MMESLNAVGFKINEKVIHFMGDEATLKLLLSDDEFTIDYITRAALSGKLSTYGIIPSNAEQMKISRLLVQEHVDLPAERNQETIVDKENIENDVGITEPITPDFNFETQSQEIFECESQPGPSNVLSDVPNTNFTEQNCVWSGKKNYSENIEATNLLLDLRGSEKYSKLFSDKKNTKQKLWNKIGEEIERQGFYLGGNIGEKCRQKFANLNKKYLSYLQNSQRTGAAAIEKPQYFDKLHEILHNKHKIAPPLIIDSLEENLEITKNEGVQSNEGTREQREEVEKDVDNENLPDNASTSNNRFLLNVENRKPKTATYRLLEEINQNQERHNRLQVEILQSMLEETNKENKLKQQMINTMNKLLCPPTRKRKRPPK